jgi:protein tyrosine/serine phosphatase
MGAMTRKRLLLIVCLSIFASSVCGVWYFFGDALFTETNRVRIDELAPTSGPARIWAQSLECEGVGNFYRVSPTLYRGAQPSEEGLKNLSEMGIKMVISLRQLHGDSDEIGDLPLKYKRLRFNTWRPKDEYVSGFLALVSDPANQPVFLHCKHGSDRTGMMCAVYRVVYDGWTKDEAINEWTKGGFGFHSIFEDLVEYFRQTDLKSLAPAPQTTQPAISGSI